MALFIPAAKGFASLSLSFSSFCVCSRSGSCSTFEPLRLIVFSLLVFLTRDNGAMEGGRDTLFSEREGTRARERERKSARARELTCRKRVRAGRKRGSAGSPPTANGSCALFSFSFDAFF